MTLDTLLKKEQEWIETFDKQLEGYVDFGVFPRGSKKPPKKHAWSAKKNRLAQRPAELQNNIIGIPKNNLVVLDIDDNGTSSTPVAQQLDILLEYVESFGRNTLISSTPGGGYHVYIIWHHHSPVPKSSVDTLKYIDLRLSGDVRSSADNSYVMLPGSTQEDEENEYDIFALTKPTKLSQEASQRLADLLPCESNAEREEYFRNKNKGAVGVLPAAKNRARQGLIKAEADVPWYHMKRAWVQKSLSCHYSDMEIADVCVDLAIDVDTNGGRFRRIGFNELIADIKRLSASEKCSAICGKEFAYNSEKPENKEILTAEEARARKLEVQKKPQKYRRYRSVSLLKAAEHIIGKPSRQRPGRAKKLAYQIVCNELNMHAAAGRVNILLARSYLMEAYGVSANQVSEAMKVLRNTGIITIAQKQFEGSTTVYQISDAFLRKDITTVLNKAIALNSDDPRWNFHECDIDWDAGTVTVVDTVTGAVTTLENQKLKNMGAILNKKLNEGGLL